MDERLLKNIGVIQWCAMLDGIFNEPNRKYAEGIGRRRQQEYVRRGVVVAVAVGASDLWLGCPRPIELQLEPGSTR